MLISTVFLRIRPAQTMEFQEVLTDSVSNGAEVNLSTVATGTIVASMPESTETQQAEIVEPSVPLVATEGTFDVQETEAVIETADETSATEMTEPIPDVGAQVEDLGVCCRPRKPPGGKCMEK